MKKTKKSEPKEGEQKEKEAKVHPDLKGFDIKINSFGEVVSTHSIDEIVQFLDKKVVDKKLKDRDGYLNSGEEA